ncbi:MAG: hypothetical protein Q7T19_05605 [Caulobacter sp.]|nr:hypothetical protein [Caulobacter sp.]
MFARLLVTFGLLIFGLLLPLLEIGDTHVFNPDWPPHARLHEVWQLVTNSSLAIMGLWLVWARGRIIMAGAIGLCVMGGVVIAHLIEARYGGALVYSGGPSLALFGISAAFLIPLAAMSSFVLAMILGRRSAG